MRLSILAHHAVARPYSFRATASRRMDPVRISNTSRDGYLRRRIVDVFPHLKLYMECLSLFDEKVRQKKQPMKKPNDATRTTMAAA